MRDFKNHSRRRPVLPRRILGVLGVTFALALVGGTATVAVILPNLPPPDELFRQRVVQSTKIYDRGGQILLYEIHGEEKRTVIPFAEIPPVVKNATIAIEDANFYRHEGIDLRGIFRALVVDLAARNFSQGGSTITQQLVKNSLLGHERTITRKVKEAILAIALEARLSKEKILDLYLNQIPYGSNAYGIEAASQTFFGKHARDLGVGEAALLAALPRAPSYYSPYGQHRDELKNRAEHILGRMQELGYLSPAEADAARRVRLEFLPATKNIRAPHFVMFVRDYLIERYGEEEVIQGGLIVTTTLDAKLQEAAEEIVREGALRNEKLIRARNMALVALDPRSGEILAMVGSRDYFDIEQEGNFNVATALRQPGSAFKPFVYATAFKKGLTPQTVIFDVPTEFNPACTPEGTPRPGSGLDPESCYHPQNYDDTFRGPVSVRQAIAQSLNVPSVKVLYLAGIEDSIRTAEDLGITSLHDRERFGLSLVLGGAEVKLLEMASAYGVFANDGIANPPTGILRVETAAGEIREEHHSAPRLVLDPDIARMINDVLSDNDARVPIFQPRSSLYFPDRPVAAKTGTTQEFRDAWTIGYTPSLVAGVWSGNNDNTPMQQKGSGVLASAPSWHAFMEFALRDAPPDEFPTPAPREVLKPILKGVWAGEVVVTIDALSRKLATDLTPPETKLDVAFGPPHDPLYWIDRRDPSGPPPRDPTHDPQYPNWESAFQRWLASSGISPPPLSAVPKEFDDIHTPENQPRLSIEKKSGPGQNLTLRISLEARFSLKEVAVLSAERVIASRTRPSNPVELIIPAEELAALDELVEIRAYDTMGNIGRAFALLSEFSP